MVQYVRNYCFSGSVFWSGVTLNTLSMSLLSFIKKNKLFLLISSLLFIAPFFWLKPGEMDLGGDSARLYFYDPISFIKHASIYDVFTGAKGVVEPNYYYLPYVGLLSILKFITSSSTTVINISNGLKLAGGFIAIYLIVRELLLQSSGTINKRLTYISAILSGIFYIVSFGSTHMSFFWDRAIMSHNQIFLNPLIFYMLLKFFLIHKYKYLCIGLIISFIFAPNFGMTSAPAFFSFYPLAILFLFFYTRIILKRTIPWNGVIIGFFLYVGVHAFHIFPQIVSLFDSGSYTNSRVFNKAEIEAGGVSYFVAVSTHGRTILNLLIPSEKHFLSLASLIAPLVVLLCFLLTKERKKELLFISLFFIVTFFLVTANITQVGFEFYRRLFYIPGFSMFRVFFTQWMYVFVFFYSILLGFSIYGIFLLLKPFYFKLMYLLVFVLLFLPGIPLFLGEPVNKTIIRGSNNVKPVLTMDHRFEETLEFVRTLPDDGKILVLPLTDSFRQIFVGSDGGAYEGPSTIAHLAGKYTYVGYQHFGYGVNIPYAEDIMEYSREKKYDYLLRIFTLLNIRYVYHNTDPKAYEKNFAQGSSYGYMQTSMPKTQKEYKDFIKQFPVKTIYSNGQYVIHEIDREAYNPTIFIPEGIYQSNALSLDKGKTHSVFIDKKTCTRQEFKKLCQTNYRKPNVDVSFRMIDPTLYSVNIRPHETIDSLFLVMQHSYHAGWKLVYNNENIADNSHISVNGYANAWLISGKDFPPNRTYTLLIKLDPQKYFWYGWAITLVSLTAVIGLLIASFRRVK